MQTLYAVSRILSLFLRLPSLFRADYDKWLNPDTPLDELKELLKPKPDEETYAKPVDEPKKPEEPEQESLF